MNRVIVITTTLIFAVLTACAGVGGVSNINTPSPSVTSRKYVANTEVVNYSNGTSLTNTAISVAVTWADDHITKPVTYTFDDGTSNPLVSVVPGATSIVYSVDSETLFTQYGDGTTLVKTNKKKASLKPLPTVKIPQ